MCWCLLFLGSLLLAGGAPAQPDRPDARFRTANEAYEEGRYTRAAEMYEGLVAGGSAHAALYYNLGNAYMRLERLGPAIRYYEKARRLRPDDPRIRHNLEQARRRAGVYPERLGDTARGLSALVADWPPWTLLWGGCVLLALGAAVAVWETRPDAPLPVWRPLVWGPAGVGLLLVGAALGASYLQSQSPRAVVVAQEAALHGTPSAEVAADTTLPEGALLEVRRRTPQWHEVRLSDGTVGWVPARALGDV